MLMYFSRSKGSETEKQSVSSNESREFHSTGLCKKQKETFQRKVPSTLLDEPYIPSTVIFYVRHYHAVYVALAIRKSVKYM